MNSDGGHRGWHDCGYLPHPDAHGRAYAITYGLDDALPRALLTAIRAGTDGDTRTIHHLDRWLDSGSGACLLREAGHAQVVIDAWRHFAGQRYRLEAYVVMPNHVHVVIADLRTPLDVVVHAWKSYTAKAIGRLCGVTGRVWHADYWDRCIRDEQHLFAAVRYVHRNPVAAGLVKNAEDWPWSSLGARRNASR